MTLLDKFAMAALASHHPLPSDERRETDLAEGCYDIASAFLRNRPANLPSSFCRRDKIALAALSIFRAQYDNQSLTVGGLAECCYEMAENMMIESGRRNV